MEGFPGQYDHPWLKKGTIVRVPKGYYREKSEPSLDGKEMWPAQKPDGWHVLLIFKNDPKEGDFAIVATSMNALEMPYSSCHVPLSLLEQENPRS